MSAIDTYFFDMGNTIFDFHQFKSDEEKDEVGLRMVVQYLKKYHPDINYEDLKVNFFDQWMTCMPKRVTELTEFPIEDFLNPCLEKYEVKLSLEKCIQVMDVFHEESGKLLVVEETALDTLRELKRRGCKVGIISNCMVYDETMIQFFKREGLDEYIDSYTFSYYLNVRKPRREIFEEALRRIGSKPEESVMIGDSLKADVLGAQSVGMKGIWFNPRGKNNKGEIVPDLEIKGLKDLVQVSYTYE